MQKYKEGNRKFCFLALGCASTVDPNLGYVYCIGILAKIFRGTQKVTAGKGSNSRKKEVCMTIEESTVCGRCVWPNNVVIFLWVYVL